jgi:dienelactone hydrolase
VVTLEAGTLLGPYEIEALIGAGGMGEVYRGRDTRLNRSVAIKVISPQLASQALFRERFERETRTISRLNHPNVCTVFDVGHQGDVHFFVMEFVEGETLAERLSRGRLSPVESLGIALQIALGLAHAHKQGIVHRDIKPANVMLTSDGAAKILDFGVAKGDQTGTGTQPGVVVGTLAYMAPEQLMDGAATPATDVWSVGVVLFEMLSGSRPFRGRDAVSLLRSIVHEPVPALQLAGAAPTGVRRIIKSAVAKDPNDRYASAAELAEDLESCLAQLSTALHPRNDFGLWRPIHRGWYAAAAVVALFAAGLTVRAVVDSRREAWARGYAIPEIRRLLAEDQYGASFVLLQQAAAYLGDDPSLTSLWPAVSVSATVVTEPSGASVSFKEYSDVAGDWQPLGQTPLQKIQLPRGAFRFKIEKEGFEPTYLARFLSGTFEPAAIVLRSVEAAGDTVHIPGDTLPVNLSGFDTEDLVTLGPFSMDRTEVTNRAFKDFVAAGGYRDPKYWRAGGLDAASFLDATGRVGPAAWELGDFPTGRGDDPVGGVSWYEAAAYCEFRRQRLPTLYHWSRAALAPYEITAPLGPSIVPLSNFSGKGLAPVAQFAGMGPYGTYDMAGNVREWVWNPSSSGRRFVLGGAWHEPEYLFSVPSSLPPDDRSLANGFRCMGLDEDTSIGEALLSSVDVASSDYRGARPVSDEVFEIFANQLAYVPAPSGGAKVEARDTTPSGAIRERVAIPVGYDDDQMRIYVFLPANGAPPYQSLIYFPALNAFQARASSAAFYPAEYVARSGRALVVPVFKGSFERWDPALGLGGEEYLRAARLRLIQWRQDLGSTIDYLMTRSDIDASRIGYYGRSFGASMPLPLLALEPRLRVAILYSGGFTYRVLPAETNAVNYVPRVKIPILMLNGRHDYVFPFETSQKPLFDLLGTPPANRRHVVYDAGHDPLPRNQFVREILAWLDRYLGPVAGSDAG